MSSTQPAEPIGETGRETTFDSPYRRNWWHVVAVVAAFAVASLVAGVAYDDPLETPWLLMGASGLLFFIGFTTPIAIFLDLRYVADVSDWEPSRLGWTAAGALAAAPIYVPVHEFTLLLPVAICLAYLYVRHSHVPLRG